VVGPQHDGISAVHTRPPIEHAERAGLLGVSRAERSTQLGGVGLF
jgi:hypothetical protein